MTTLAVVLGAGPIAAASPLAPVLAPAQDPVRWTGSFELGGSFGSTFGIHAGASVGAYAGAGYLMEVDERAIGLFVRVNAVGFSDDGLAGYGSLNAGFQLWGQHWGYLSSAGYGVALHPSWDDHGDRVSSHESGLALEGRISYAINGHQRSGLVLSAGVSMLVFGLGFWDFLRTEYSPMLSVGYQVF